MKWPFHLLSKQNKKYTLTSSNSYCKRLRQGAISFKKFENVVIQDDYNDQNAIESFFLENHKF